MKKITTLNPCGKDVCPMTEEAATLVGFVQNDGVDSPVGQNAIKRLEKIGMDYETVITCTRLNCHHLRQFHQQTFEVMDILAGAAEIMRNKKPY